MLPRLRSVRRDGDSLSIFQSLNPESNRSWSGSVAAFGSCLVANPDRETWSDISEISAMSNPFSLSRY